jgi:hypothetical protein
VRVGACALAVALTFGANALAQPDPCAGEPKSLRARGERYTVHFSPVPKPEVGRHFALVVSVCGRHGATSPESLAIDARMPSHGHGMNYRPTVVALGGARYRAEGLMLHMPGEWELIFVVKDSGSSERMTHTLVLR